MIPPKAGQHENSNAPIRLGVLVDDDCVPRYVNELMGELSTRADMELAAVIVHLPLRSQGSSANSRKGTGKYSSLVKLDRILTSVAVFFIAAIETLMLRLRNQTSHPLRPEPLKHQPDALVRLTPLPAEANSHCNYSQTDLELLTGLSLDYLVIESKREPAWAARTHLAKSGVIRMRFGDLPAIPVRQAGFKEVCQRNPTSKFRVVLLHGRGETPIFEGAFQTRLSLVDNRNELIRKAYPYLWHAIATHFARSNPGKPERTDSDEPIHATAMECLLSCRELMDSLWPRLKMIGTGVLNLVLGRKDHWQVSWYRGGWPEVATAKSNLVESPSGSFLADPFVVNRDGRRICFVEEYKYRNRRGVISALELAGTSARMLGTIIDEPFHLSFPFIFEFESRLYMCPESAEAGQIRVYECVDFPMKWRLCKVLMDKVRAADTMLFEHDGRWWMFTNIDPQGSNDYESRLYLFWSDSPLSTTWNPHPQNPVVFDPSSGRNGGFVTRQGELFRCAQRQGFPQYGEAFSIRKITDLTTERYAEQLHLSVEPENFGARGTHHIHHDGEIVVRDECHLTRPRQ